jgi:S-adenosylmethionine:tRNA ribosyltransferase-isomerase
MMNHIQLKTSDFHYDLPASLIAQRPAPRREESRLFVYHRESGLLEHRCFRDIRDYIKGGSLLVLNDTRVIPARLYGRKVKTGGRVELLLVKEGEGGEWECMVRPSGRVKRETAVAFDGTAMTATVGNRTGPGMFLVRFEGTDDFWNEIDRIGIMPLPPYIKRTAAGKGIADRGISDAVEAEDRERYQTVYARTRGAIAAPTAGLHFSEGLLRELKERGVETVTLTLHVGVGTFRPVKERFVRDHNMHAEYFEISEETAGAINKAHAEKRPIFVVGTTAARALEASADEKGRVRPYRGWTDIFIYPPYRFKLVQNIVTNFHLPESTLLMMIAALVGREKIIDLYRAAVGERYRFYSYGDAMLII